MAATITAKAFFAIVAMAAVVELGMAKNITVGAPGGSWNLTTNLASWASSQTFTQGDNLIFSYDSSSHDVLEVNKADYDSCSTSNPMDTHKTGKDVISLSSTGKRYFICGILGHCAGGMKVEIDTVAASTTPSPPSSSPPSPSTTPSPPSSSSPSPSGTPSPPPSGKPSPPSGTPSPPPSGTPSPPGKSGASGRGLGAKAAVGFGFGLGMLMVLAH